ncbi:unnamed protein product [Gadus morhua 'NCC']
MRQKETETEVEAEDGREEFGCDEASGIFTNTSSNAVAEGSPLRSLLGNKVVIRPESCREREKRRADHCHYLPDDQEEDLSSDGLWLEET